MTKLEIAELQRVFISRLDTLDHILDVAEMSLPDLGAALQERIAPDMFPLGTQIAFACNQPRGFSQWSMGHRVDSLAAEVDSVELARNYIAGTRALVAAVSIDDSKLDEVKRVGLGPGLYCELPARQYVSDFLLPNFYFHISIAYAILRKIGVPIGKTDYMNFLAPHVKREAAP
ncbi:DUF1993 domain-containing protein [Luteibacter jiangsuensis]|uniref:DUF1993 domain-containing protein n=1 Tax=Luteibacter jiangsuensis TaxID=637577 RepID=A0ABX0Q1X2_9GAMM|nr:DUF1993 domain-containing protein [Luteibacter jiangsuensis]NID04504.1 DUF1993 domain-containing protein [Luteibacter jiangsuensis]